MAILLATTATATSAAAAAAAASTFAVIVQAGIAPAFAVIDNVGRRPLHSATVALAATATVAALPSSADGLHTTSAVVSTAIFCFLIVDC